MEACRMCANVYARTETDFVDLFEMVEGFGFQRELDFIHIELRAWQFKIAPNDGLPQRMCANCFTKFCSIDAFRQECELAQQKLLQSVLESCKMEQSVQAQIMHATTNDIYLAAEAPVEAEVVVGLEPDHELEVNDPHNINNYAVYEQNFGDFHNAATAEGVAETNSQMIVAPLMDGGNVLNAYISPAEVTSQDLYFDQQIPMTFATEADCILDSKVIEAEMETIVSQDLEEMLQGSVIATKLKNPASATEDAPSEESKLKNEDFSDDCDELDEADDFELPTTRLSGNSLACQYCYCHTNGSVDHLIFADSEALSQHFFDMHDPNQPYPCPFCAQKYELQKSRDNHVRLLHSAVIKLEFCEYCKKTLRSSVEQHQYTCTFVGDWECSVCGEQFPQKPLHRFRTHQRLHEPSKQLRCRTCDRGFVRRANLESHERLHTMTVPNKIPCNECTSTFLGEYELKRHKYQAHNGELPAKCEHCNKGFISNAFLSRHVQHFHPEKLDASNSDVVTCSNCSLTFSSLHKLRFHVQRPRDENGKCTDLVFKEKRRQQRQGIYPCPHCAKRFHIKAQLDKHVNTHDARLRPYQCDQCHIRCRTAFELKQHVNVSHLHIKAFECEVCGKRFGYQKDLRHHMLFHAEINVSCSESGCDFVCKNDKALNDHIRHKHRLIPCEYCGQTFTRQRLVTHLRNEHRNVIDLQVSDEAVSSFLGHSDKVHVQLVNDSEANALSLQDQPTNAYKPLIVPDEFVHGQFFIDSLIDPEHEIIVT